MPCITINPNDTVCPDYTSQEHAELREPLIGNGSTNAQAAQLLTAIWHKQHGTDCQQWDVQTAADTAQEDNQQAQHQQEKKRIEDEAEKERLEVEKEERKKNKAKYTPILNRPIPLQQPVIASPTALKKLAKGKYVSLYWTPPGIESARSLFINLDAPLPLSKTTMGPPPSLPLSLRKNLAQ